MKNKGIKPGIYELSGLSKYITHSIWSTYILSNNGDGNLKRNYKLI